MENIELVCLLLTRDVAGRCPADVKCACSTSSIMKDLLLTRAVARGCHTGVKCTCSTSSFSSDFWPAELEEVL